MAADEPENARHEPSDRPPAVEAVGVSKRFGPTKALTDVSLLVESGSSHALVGRNGAGKSTLVGVLTGLVRADEGKIRFAGQPAPRPDDRAAWKGLVSCVYQHFTLNTQLTVAENLFVNSHPRNRLGLISWRRLQTQAQSLLDEWGLTIRATAEVGDLRVEDRQQVEIARALASGSRFLILDEPTAWLEGTATRRLFERLAALRDRGVSLLYISHHLDEIYEVCDHVTVLRDGRRVHVGPVSELPKPQLVVAMVGDEEDPSARTATPPRSRSTMTSDTSDGLRAEQLSVDGFCRDISLEVLPGQLLGLAGLASSGKTQVAEAIAGLIRPKSGMVVVAGRSVPPGDVRQAIRSGIGFVPQDRHAEGFAPNLSIEENITLTAFDRFTRMGVISRRAREQLATRLTSSMGIVASGPEQLVSELSGGNQQKVVVARALVNEPKVLVVVNPTAGVDVASKEALFATLKSLADVAVLVVSDDLDELRYCDRVLVMFDGRLSSEFTTWDEHRLVTAMEGISAHDS